VRLGEIWIEVAVGSSEIARRVESGERAERDRCRPAEAALEHAPYRERQAERASSIVQRLSGEQATNAIGLDRDAIECTERHGIVEVAHRGYRLVKDHRGLSQPAERRGALEVAGWKRLFEAREAKRIHSLQRATVLPVRQVIRPVRICGERYLRERGAHRGEH